MLVRADCAVSAMQRCSPETYAPGLLLCTDRDCVLSLQEANVHVRTPPARDAQLGPPPPLLLAVRQESEDALGPAAQVCTA